MNNVFTRTETPDSKSYLPSKESKKYKLGSSYEFLFWNGVRLDRDESGNITDEQIFEAFYILEGEVISFDGEKSIDVQFSKGINTPVTKKYSLNSSDKRYLDTWKKLVELTKAGGTKTISTGVTEDDGSDSKGVTEDTGRATGRGVTEDTPLKGTGRGVTEDMPTGVTEDN
jgi:hypothetical protein